MIESGQLIKELSDQQSELGKLAKAESTSHDVGAYDYNGSLTGEGLDNSGSEPWWKDANNNSDLPLDESHDHNIIDFDEPLSSGTGIFDESIPSSANELIYIPKNSAVENTNDNLIDEYTDEIKQIKTINSGLEGQNHPVTDVPFERKVVTTETGEKVEGVFPQFDSKFDAQLPKELELASDADQFAECNRQLKEKYDSDPSFRDQVDERQKENIEEGGTPYGYTWHHNEETGKMQLVDYDTHQKTGHTGGRSVWGGGSENR